MTVTVLDSVLALTKSVPKLDGTVPGSRDDLTVINRESDGKYILGVTNKTTSSGTSSKVPKAELTIPTPRESELTIGGENNILNKVRVTCETALGNTVDLVLLVEFPEDDGFVPRCSHDHVAVVDGGCDGCHHVGVCVHGAAELELFAHG